MKIPYILTILALLLPRSPIRAQARLASQTLSQAFSPPPGYERTTVKPQSFAHFLRNLPLKPDGARVRYFDGRIKEKAGVYARVVDYSLGKRDLQQCADAVMRLRAEYWYQANQFGKIRFNFLVDGKPRFFTHYARGKTDRQAFDAYLDFVFQSANTASLRNELKPVSDPLSMQIGDVFIVRGNPFGHAVIVVDMAMEPQTGKKVFLLAQSYMPAQDIQILLNPNDTGLSPWYELKDGALTTPEWTFPAGNLRRFTD